MGIITSLLAIYIHKWWVKRALVNKLSHCEGYWLEEISGQDDRIYSIGHFKYDKHNQNYQYSGDNFCNNGEYFYSWRSISVELVSDYFFYIYQTCLKEKYHEPRHGFGLTNLQPHNGDSNQLIFLDGYFVDTGKKPELKTIIFYDLDKVIEKLGIKKSRDENLREFHSRIVKNYYENKQS